MDTTDYGTVTMRGRKYSLTQNAYLDDDHSVTPPRAIYRATAVDEHGEGYEITWDIICPECEDESDACDWEHPAAIYTVDGDRIF
jgi:hypothetical protein